MERLVPRDRWQRPNALGRLRSRQAGHPSGLLGRFVGRAMVKDTWSANERNLELLGDVEGTTVLDLGFGQGRMVEALVAAGAQVLGAEVSVTMLAQAAAANVEAVGRGQVDLRVGDGVRIPFDDDSADAVTTAHTIYFMPEPETTLSEAGRVLRPGGRLVVAFVAADRGVARWKDPTVYRMYLTDEVVELVEGAGFADVEVHDGAAAPVDLRWVTAAADGPGATASYTPATPPPD